MTLKTALVIFALLLGVAIVAAVFYARTRIEDEAVAKIPDEFRYIYVNFDKVIFANFIAIDLRNKKMLLELDGKRKIYDFSDIKEHKRDTHEIESRRSRGKVTVQDGEIKPNGRIINLTVYDLTLHVNDPENPTWQFSSGVEDEIDCAQLLLSRAFDGTLPDTDERKVLSLKNAKKFRSLLPAYTGTK